VAAYLKSEKEENFARVQKVSKKTRIATTKPGAASTYFLLSCKSSLRKQGLKHELLPHHQFGVL